jgi:hypothetical protein
LANSTLIELIDSAPRTRVTITQLYPHIELLSEGDPPQHSLFVMGRTSLNIGQTQDDFLLIDPPSDVTSRFRLEGRVAAIYTGETHHPGVALVHSLPGGLAHVRIGDHLLDIYSQKGRAVVHLPTLGIICAGDLGSDAILPAVAASSIGEDELEALRLLARLVRGRKPQIFIPSVGALRSDMVEVMERLADDVAYLHGLRRVIPTMASNGDPLDAALALADTLLPVNRRTPVCQAINRENVRRLFASNGRELETG